MSVQSEGGRSRKVAARGRAAEGNGRPRWSTGDMRLNSQKNDPANPFNPQPPRWGGKLSDLQMGIDLQLSLPFFYKPVGGALTECH